MLEVEGTLAITYINFLFLQSSSLAPISLRVMKISS